MKRSVENAVMGTTCNMKEKIKDKILREFGIFCFVYFPFNDI